MPEPPVLVRPGRLLRFGAALVVLLAVVGYLIVQYTSGGRRAPRCTVVSGKDDNAVYHFSAEQTANAATIAAVGTTRGMPERAVTIALATALQESDLHNIDHGDRDSLGLFQQRPSQGWGTAKQIMDPDHAAGRFYDHLAKVPGHARLPLTVAAQRVQRSGYPQAYARHEPDATVLAAALTGRAAGALTCEGRPATRPGDPAEVRAALVRDFGRDVLDEAAATVPRSSRHSSRHRSAPSAPSAPSSISSVSSLHASSAVTVPVHASDDRVEGGPRQRGWELAHWAVANSTALGIDRVAFAGRQWTSQDSDGKWRATGGDGTGDGKGRGDGGRSAATGTARGGDRDGGRDTGGGGDRGRAGDRAVSIVTAG